MYVCETQGPTSSNNGSNNSMQHNLNIAETPLLDLVRQEGKVLQRCVESFALVPPGFHFATLSFVFLFSHFIYFYI